MHNYLFLIELKPSSLLDSTCTVHFFKCSCNNYCGEFYGNAILSYKLLLNYNAIISHNKIWQKPVAVGFLSTQGN